jgi:hypothetical protein
LPPAKWSCQVERLEEIDRALAQLEQDELALNRTGIPESAGI